MQTVDRRRFLIGSAVTALASGAASEFIIGRKALASEDKSEEGSSAPAGPFTLFTATLINVRHAHDEITVRIDNFDPVPITLRVPKHIPIAKRAFRAGLESLVPGDHLHVGVEFPPDRSWVTVHWITANFSGGLAVIESYDGNSKAATAYPAYYDMSSVPQRPCTLQLTEHSMLNNAPTARMTDAEIAESLSYDQLISYAATSDAPNGDLRYVLNLHVLRG